MKKKMNHLILAETEFFALINEDENGCIESAYGSFINAIVALGHDCTDRNSSAVVLDYTGNELQRLAASHVQILPLSNPSNTSKQTTATTTLTLQWTGSIPTR